MTILDECWEWKGHRNQNGYGLKYVPWLRKQERTHRLAWAWAWANGYWGKKLPKEMHILHRCDNPPCCNPAHLFLGTHLDNVRDAYQKGRMAKKRWSYCRKGHELVTTNIYIHPDGKHECRTCRDARDRYWSLARRSS